MGADQGRARVASLLPDGVRDPMGWSRDVFAAFAALDVTPSTPNICAAVAIIEQESGFRSDPEVPGLPRIVWREIDRRRADAGIPKWMVSAALAIPSSDGRTFKARIDKVRTEREMSAIFEDFISLAPLGETLFGARNPVRTGGPMQVSVAFAEAYASTRPYPYPVAHSIRHEVFTRRGGVYFGIAHLLDYTPPYTRYAERFADYNAGRYSSRNAAFQEALTQVSGIPLVLDGDLLKYQEGAQASTPSATQLAIRAALRRLDLEPAGVEMDLRLEKSAAFEQTLLYRRVFVLADRLQGRPVPRAVIPRIELKSPKIQRRLTTAWFVDRVGERFRRCLRRDALVGAVDAY